MRHISKGAIKNTLVTIWMLIISLLGIYYVNHTLGDVDSIKTAQQRRANADKIHNILNDRLRVLEEKDCNCKLPDTNLDLDEGVETLPQPTP